MSRYKVPFAQYKACQRMTKNEFSRWLEVFADEMWKQGYAKACEDVPDGAVVIDTTDTMVVYISEDNMREVLMSVPGVGPKLCDKIIGRVYEAFDGYIKEEHALESPEPFKYPFE